MSRLRALLTLFLLSYSVATAGLVHAQAFTSGSAAAVAAPAAEAMDAAAQAQVVESAFNLLMDRFVRPLNSAEVLTAGWEQLSKDASGKAAAPGAAPAFDGNREADFEKMRLALTAYLK